MKTPLRCRWTGNPLRSCEVGAFARADLAALLAVLTLVAIVIFPALAGPRQRSERVTCANNLRQVGTAFHLWGNDHDDQLPQEVPVAAGGTRQHPLAVNVWLHFAWLSNELNSAALLFCPTDSGQPARDFSGDPAGGYVHPNFGDRATSYFVAHLYDGASRRSNAPLAGDRNVGVDNVSSCSRFIIARVASRPTAGFIWSNNLHRKSGNILRLDGRVDQFSNGDLRASTVPPPTEPGGTLHFIVPR